MVDCLHPWCRSVQRLECRCLEGSCLGSKKQHRQLAGGLRLSVWLLGTCPHGSSWHCRQELVLGAPWSTSLHQGQEPYTNDRIQGGHRVSARLEGP